MTAARRILTAQLAAAVAALLGLVLLVLGATHGSDGSGDSTAAGTTRLDGVVAVTTRTEVLAEGASRVRLEASATTSAAPVFVGVARADDVAAWLGDLARVDVLGAGEEGTLDIARTGTGRTAPDPARADIWAATALAQGAAQLDWTPAPGQWRAVVVAGTAAGGLERVDVEWVRPPGGSSAPALIAIGLVLLVAGAVALAVLRRRGRSGPDSKRYADGDEGDDGDDGGDGDDGEDDPDDTDGTDPDATTTIPRVPGRRRAGAPPWARVAPLALVVTLGVTACSSGSDGGSSAPGAVAASSSGTPAVSIGPAYPALLVPQAEDVLDQVDAALAAINRSGRVADADGRVVGPYAQRLAAELKIRQKLVPAAAPPQTRSASPSASPSVSPASSSTAGMARDRLLLTRQADWPRFFVVAGSAPGRPTPVVRVLVSPTVRDPYGVWAEPVLLPGASLPGVAAATVGAQTLGPGATGLVAPPEQVAKGYADVLTNSTKSASAALFAPDEFRRQVSSRFAQDRRSVAVVGTVTSTHSLLPEGLLTFRTADGGAVVVAALEQRYTVTVKAGAGSVRVDERLAALGGKPAYSKRLERTSVEVVVLAVPPAGGGLVRVVAASKDDVAVSGS